MVILNSALVLARHRYLFLLFLWLFSEAASGEIIPQNRRTIWQGNVGVQGGIPSRTAIYQTLNPGATAAQINTAIANCPDGQVVFLSAGTYNLSAGITIARSNVTLRGAGPTQTILKFNTGGWAFINVSTGAPERPSVVTNWTGGYSQGTATVTIANTAGFNVGNLVCLDQLNDSAYVGYGTEGATDTGQNLDRLQYQLSEITAINGNQVSISPGIYMPNYSASFSPQMWNVTTGGTKLQYVGVENLQVDGTDGGAGFNIYFAITQNCWVKNIKSLKAGTAHVRTFRVKKLEVRDSTLVGNRTFGVGAYSILLWTATQSLLENNICGPGTIILQSGSAGCVVGYNYYYNDMGSGWMGYILANHNAHPCYNLYEGNIAPQLTADYIHGSGSHLTYLRNWLHGTSPGAGSNMHAIHIEMYNRYFNIVGNVLGTAGTQHRYEDYGPSGTWHEDSVYKLAYRGNYDATSDSVVYTSLLRHGNFDVIHNGIVWDGGIADRNIPSSLYLAGRPSWFGNLTWPPIDPSNPSGASTTSIPAGYRFVNGSDPPAGGPTPTPTATPIPTATPTPTPTPTPASVGVGFSSTSGTITPPFTINSDDTISQTILTTEPSQGGKAVYQFDAPNPGDYVVSAKVNCPDGGSNSFFVNIDAEPSSAMVWDIPITTGLETRNVTWDPSTTPQIWTLAAGIHTLIIRGRESDAKLGQITISTASEATPTPTPTATPTPSDSPTPPTSGSVTPTPTPTDSPTPPTSESATPTPTPSSPTPTPPESPTPTPTPPPTPTPSNSPTPVPVGTTFSSTGGTIVPPLAVNSDGTVSQSVQTIVPSQGGKAVYEFSVSSSGTYFVSAKVNCPDGGSNSFFVGVDVDPSATMLWDIPAMPGLAARPVIWNSSGPPQAWTLGPGTHQLIVRGREANAKLGPITVFPAAAAATPPPPQQPIAGP